MVFESLKIQVFLFNFIDSIQKMNKKISSNFTFFMILTHYLPMHVLYGFCCAIILSCFITESFKYFMVFPAAYTTKQSRNSITCGLHSSRFPCLFYQRCSMCSTICQPSSCDSHCAIKVRNLEIINNKMSMTQKFKLK